MPRPMSTYTPSVVGRDAAAYDCAAEMAPMWERRPDEWSRHTDTFRKAYRAAWKTGEVASDGV